MVEVCYLMVKLPWCCGVFCDHACDFETQLVGSTLHES